MGQKLCVVRGATVQQCFGPGARSCLLCLHNRPWLLHKTVPTICLQAGGSKLFCCNAAALPDAMAGYCQYLQGLHPLETAQSPLSYGNMRTLLQTLHGLSTPQTCLASPGDCAYRMHALNKALRVKAPTQVKRCVWFAAPGRRQARLSRNVPICCCRCCCRRSDGPSPRDPNVTKVTSEIDSSMMPLLEGW